MANFVLGKALGKTKCCFTLSWELIYSKNMLGNYIRPTRSSQFNSELAKIEFKGERLPKMVLDFSYVGAANKK